VLLIDIVHCHFQIARWVGKEIIPGICHGETGTYGCVQLSLASYDDTLLGSLIHYELCELQVDDSEEMPSDVLDRAGGYEYSYSKLLSALVPADLLI
jgi:hypothetical protein